jgi:peptidyl-prolyl cis-trans isomerase C
MSKFIVFASQSLRYSLALLALVGAVPEVLAQQTVTKQNASQPPVSVLARSSTLGAAVSTVDLFSELQRAPATARESFIANPAAVEQHVNNLLIRRALAKEAERDGLDKDTLMVAALQIARDKVLSEARLAKLDIQNEPASAAVETQARAIYQANLSKFEQPEQTRARHILLANNGSESLARAKALLVQLRAGASFEELAKTHSTDPGSAVRGGDLGYFGPGKMVRPFEEALNALKNPGDISELVESQFGYHIIKLEERRPKGSKPFEEVKGQLVAEARTALLNEARVQKAESLNKDFVFETAAFEAFLKAAATK